MTAATSPACWKLQLGLLEMLPLGVIAARTPAPAARPYVAAPALAPPCFASEPRGREATALTRRPHAHRPALPLALPRNAAFVARSTLRKDALAGLAGARGPGAHVMALRLR